MSFSRLARALRAPWRPIVLAVASAMMLASTASAMRVSPMVAELTTTGAGAVARIEVGNVGTAALPFETSITRIELDENGAVIETPGDEDFLVFPSQGLVPVSGRQVVRVQWVGPELQQSRAYYLSVRQLPVAVTPDVNEAGASLAVSVLYNMKALLVIAPPGVEPNVEVESVKPIMIEGPERDPTLPPEEVQPEIPPVPGLEVAVRNTGDRYALMSGATWVIDGMDTNGQPYSRRFTGGDISSAVGVGYLPPGGGRRVFKLPIERALDPAHPVSLRFTR